MKTVRARWFKLDLQGFYELITYVEKTNPTIHQVAENLRVGIPKARSILEYLNMFGVVKINRNQYYLNDIYKDIMNILTQKELNEIMLYNFIQNYDLMNWLFVDLCNNLINRGIYEIDIESIKRKTEDFKIKYNSNVNENTIKTQIVKELNVIIKKSINLEIQKSSNFPISNLNLLSENDNGGSIRIYRYNEISLRTLVLLFFVSWTTNFKGITNININEVISHPKFPFRVFLIDQEKTLELLVKLEKLNIIKIVTSVDLKHITLNPNMMYCDVIRLLGEISL